ncbi:MAG: hypothetical protein WB715_27385 [Roseiarcus sp.]|uniref:hypothetical protein n=1 Tax=Roseiarcus sp. TaxID=1969460 RepID=UPI003C608623
MELIDERMDVVVPIGVRGTPTSCWELASTDPLQRRDQAHSLDSTVLLLGLRDRFTSIRGRHLKSQIRKSGHAYHDWEGSTGAYEVRIQFAERVPGSFHDPYKMASVNEGMAHPTNERVQNNIGMLEPLR